DGLDVVALERCDGAHGQRSASAVGQRKPLHCTSQGKAILAALPAEERDALVRELPMTAVTPRSITDRRRLQAELRVAAARGWAVDDEEIVPGVRCCGAAIVDAAGQVRGAISVAGPAFRLTSERVELLGPEVAEAARRIGAQLSAAEQPRVEGEARLVGAAWAFEGRFPCWLPGASALVWADTLGPTVHRASAVGDVLLTQADAPIQALLPWHEGAAAGQTDASAVLARWGGGWHLVHSNGEVLPAEAAISPGADSTAVCMHPDGSIWACLPAGGRWRVAPVHAASGARGSAGSLGWDVPEPASDMAWDPTGAVLHLACAGSGSLWTARPGSPALRRLATVPKGSGHLAGLAVDPRGGVWIALRGGWGVMRFEADGSLDRLVALPVPCPSGLAFGGADGHTLFITTARDAVSREALDAAPLSGRLFALAT
ncbi:MAG: IclR family transcriptional regulator C-terminal domain-containing protein, partial [Rubrivivax sp.]|nr:IclR family transcriptional regulator C-terminal domain-containing protein [Rubrivivax sp.]